MSCDSWRRSGKASLRGGLDRVKYWESLVWTLGFPAPAPLGTERAGLDSPGSTPRPVGREAPRREGSGSRGKLAFSPGCSQADVSLAGRLFQTRSARIPEAKPKERDRDRDGERQLCFQAGLKLLLPEGARPAALPPATREAWEMSPGFINTVIPDRIPPSHARQASRGSDS